MRMQLQPLQPVGDVVRGVFVETLQTSAAIELDSFVQ